MSKPQKKVKRLSKFNLVSNFISIVPSALQQMMQGTGQHSYKAENWLEMGLLEAIKLKFFIVFHIFLHTKTLPLLRFCFTRNYF